MHRSPVEPISYWDVIIIINIYKGRWHLSDGEKRAGTANVPVPKTKTAEATMASTVEVPMWSVSVVSPASKKTSRRSSGDPVLVAGSLYYILLSSFLCLRTANDAKPRSRCASSTHSTLSSTIPPEARAPARSGYEIADRLSSGYCNGRLLSDATPPPILFAGIARENHMYY